MLSSVALLALPIAFDPVRLGVNLLLISRPRPARNLLVYWIGCVTASFLLLVVPLLILHYTPAFAPFVHDLANPATGASSTVRYVELGIGVLLLVLAVALALSLLVRRESSAEDRPSPFARVLQRGRLGAAWSSGALWVALLIGFWAGPNPSLVTFSLASILASGASLAAQLSAAVVFVVVSLAIVELVLVCSVVEPARTHTVLQRVHDWARRYRRQLLVAILAIVGVAFVLQGVG
jgi:hypothetical protein